MCDDCTQAMEDRRMDEPECEVCGGPADPEFSSLDGLRCEQDAEP